MNFTREAARTPSVADVPATVTVTLFVAPVGFVTIVNDATVEPAGTLTVDGAEATVVSLMRIL